MKVIYSHTQLLSLRHECQEQLAKAFFVTYSLQCVYLESQPNISFPALFHGMYSGHHPKISVHYSRGVRQGFKPNNSRSPYIGPAPLCAKTNNAVVQSEKPAIKGAFASLESFQLVKIPLSLGELPPGSKIIKVRPGNPVPVNAIPISLTHNTPGKPVKKSQEKAKPPPGPALSEISKKQKQKQKKCDVTYASLSYDGATYYSAESTNDQNYFAATGDAPAPNQVPGADAGTTRGPTIRASSETKYHYARFFEPYMRKFLGTSTTPQTLLGNEKKAPIVAVTPSTSYESESATEYSSDSSNIQIQLPQ